MSALMDASGDLDTATLKRLEEGHERRLSSLRTREVLTDGALAALFLAGALVLALVAEPERELDVLLALAFVVAYAIVASSEFNTGIGYAVPTQVVLVPMLLLLPTPLVPLLVGLAYLLQTATEVARRRVAPARLLVSLADAWIALPPALVLILAEAQLPSWDDWSVYGLALVAQLAADVLVSVVRARAAVGVPAREMLQEMAVASPIDGALAAVGLLAAMGARDEPYTALLVLPLVGLFALVSREREGRIARSLELSQAYRGTALVLHDVLEEDDEYTARHTEGVVQLALRVADSLGVDEDTRRTAELGALLHDVGKIAVPNEIINKPGPLDEAEWQVIRTHTISGQRMLERVGGLLARVGLVVRASHERWDGEGYPDGLVGERIPLAARIVAACDAFDAMTSRRAFREAYDREQTIAYLEDEVGRLLDPAVFAALKKVVLRHKTLTFIDDLHA